MASTPRSASTNRLRRRSLTGTTSRDSRDMAVRAERRKSAPIDRTTMLLMEANEITQCLQKQYTFRKENDGITDDQETGVKVTNCKLGISCIWSLAKLKERLVRMRKLVYQSDTEPSSLSADAVFFDPTDTWVNEDGADHRSTTPSPATTSTSPSPVPGASRNRHADTEELPRPYEDSRNRERDRDPCGAASPRPGLNLRLPHPDLPADTSFLPAEAPPGDSHRENSALPHKYLTGSLQTETTRAAAHSPSPDGRTVRTSTLRRGRTIRQDSPTQRHFQRNGIESQNGALTKTLAVQHQSCQTVLPPTVPALTMCRSLVEGIRDRLHENNKDETLLDKVLHNCESIKVAVCNILEGHAQGQDSDHGVVIWADSDLMRATTLHLVAALEMLTSHVTCWVASFTPSVLLESFGKPEVSRTLQSPSPSPARCENCRLHQGALCASHQTPEEYAIRNAQLQFAETLQKLAIDLTVFLQLAEQDCDSEVHDSSSRVFEHVYDLCRRCGQLALAADETPAMWDNTDNLDDLMSFDSRKEREPFRPTPGCDVKQAFLTGSDAAVDQTLAGTLLTAGKCEQQLRSLSGLNGKDEAVGDVLKHVYVVVATARATAQKVRQVQAELQTAVRQDPDQHDRYFKAHYTRNTSVITHASQLGDALTLFGQVAACMVTDGEPGSLKKITRCGEIVLKSCCRLAALRGLGKDSPYDGRIPRSITPSPSLSGILSPRVKGKFCVSLSRDNKSDHPLVAVVLAPKQIEVLERAVVDVNTAVMSLINSVQCHLPADLDSSRSRRMLPVVPARPLSRSNSAKQATPARRRIGRDLTSMHFRKSVEV